MKKAVKNDLIERQQRIQELLKALNDCPEEDMIWIINQLQELGYTFE